MAEKKSTKKTAKSKDTEAKSTKSKTTTKATKTKAKSTKSKTTTKATKTKAKSTKSKSKKDEPVGDLGIVIVDDDIEIDQEKVNEERRAYLEEARSQEAFD
ncbi:hypothetical protein Nisw_00470 [Candidatus Nitrosopumilus sp. SW]|uniref:hypothetical protein n=1 Tax=Candidatus Nitrosopumilus sp. SW TaxID=2508726 RepID=UPI00114DD5D0|nr:hypothetical protein [Candidatus Nitrosopumilus sp. SW]QDI88110.1 hypothetical protein Nisw_00470 [Candidatus Nitrosopumilus sp. SW]